MVFENIKWIENKSLVTIIDQTQLPIKKVIKEITSIEQMWEAIKMLRVRGAPLIGVSAGYGLLLGLIELNKSNISDFDLYFDKIFESIEYIKTSRPTAVNLFWVADQFKSLTTKIKNDFEISNSDNKCLNIKQTEILKDICYKKFMNLAIKIHNDDKNMCEQIGEHGLELLENGDSILTHCNAGSLATSAWGTALAPIYKAYDKGYDITVYSDETRPLLQGSRLTAYELIDKGIKTYTICDDMAGYVMKLGKISKIIVGADRIALNGDFANKIGTYSVAILAKFHNIPLYVAAPSSTFDFNIESGNDIPIEERGKEEIIHGYGKQTAPENVNIFNPAFDITPANLVTAFITEKGIIKPPFKDKFKNLLS